MRCTLHLHPRIRKDGGCWRKGVGLPDVMHLVDQTLFLSLTLATDVRLGCKLTHDGRKKSDIRVFLKEGVLVPAMQVFADAF